MKIAVLGSNGFVGSEISSEIKNSKDFSLLPVVRGDSLEDAIAEADVIIHSANSAKDSS